MSLKHLLVHVDAGPRSAERIALAATLARRFGAKLTGLFAESRQLGASLVARRSPQNIARAAVEARNVFEQQAGPAEIETEWWEVPPGEYDEVVSWTVVSCRYADLAVLGQPGDEERVPPDVTERVIFESGRPVLVVPAVGHYPDAGRRILVAWTGSRESARALNDALPLLEGAEEVRVLSFQAPPTGAAGATPPVSIVDHLRAHGIAVKYEAAIVDEAGVLDPLLNRAADTSADLTVLGAYPPGGIHPLQRSRTTRDILRTMTTPVLLSH